MFREIYYNSRKLQCDCDKLYDVIADVASYPQYLPGWEQVEVEKLSNDTVRVRQHVRSGPFEEQLVSIAYFQRPHRITVNPESDYNNAGIALDWQFFPRPQGGCRLVFRISASAHNSMLESMLNGLSRYVVEKMIERFLPRVESIYDIQCKSD